jgi:hypothetical protein
MLTGIACHPASVQSARVGARHSGYGVRRGYAETRHDQGRRRGDALAGLAATFAPAASPDPSQLRGMALARGPGRDDREHGSAVVGRKELTRDRERALCCETALMLPIVPREASLRRSGDSANRETGFCPSSETRSRTALSGGTVLSNPSVRLTIG